jgi:Uma2 family endonuclease
MGSVPELAAQPLGVEQLARRYRELIDDPRFANVQGKIELDAWGRVVVSPATNLHGLIQGRLARRLSALAGEVLVEASVSTPRGVQVADVAWMSPPSVAALGTQTPFPRAPDLCVEVASPSNSGAELQARVSTYLASGASEVWVVRPQSRRIDAFGPDGLLDHTRIEVDLEGIFESP